MVFSPNFTEIGYVEKTHGTAGWIKINFYDLKNSIPKKGMEFLFLQMDSSVVPYKIEQVNMKAGLVKFFDFDNPTVAQKLVGKVIFTDKELPKTKDSTEWLPLHYLIVDQLNTSIGKVIDLTEIPGNPLIEVETEHGIIQLPWNTDLIIEIDKIKKTITYNILDGLLEL